MLTSRILKYFSYEHITLSFKQHENRINHSILTFYGSFGSMSSFFFFFFVYTVLLKDLLVGVGSVAFMITTHKEIHWYVRTLCDSQMIAFSLFIYLYCSWC